jgi:hypothetical protein|tara:strand:+ start:272 stop:598 length:327 start_codon:yes stop_codon:yes gene_type:complete
MNTLHNIVNNEKKKSKTIILEGNKRTEFTIDFDTNVLIKKLFINVPYISSLTINQESINNNLVKGEYSLYNSSDMTIILQVEENIIFYQQPKKIYNHLRNKYKEFIKS